MLYLILLPRDTPATSRFKLVVNRLKRNDVEIRVPATSPLLTSALRQEGLRPWQHPNASSPHLVQAAKHTPCSYTLTSNHDVKVDDSPPKVWFHLSPQERNVLRTRFMQVLSISTTTLNACITGNLPLAEDLLTQEIDGEADNYNSYANRAFVMALIGTERSMMRLR